MKKIVITGSTRGIGFGLARSFLELGQSVVVSGRTAETVESVRAALAKTYGEDRVAGIPCDVTQCDAVQALWERAVDAFGSIDIWINNAGISHPQVTPWEQTIDCARIDDCSSNCESIGIRCGVRRGNTEDADCGGGYDNDRCVSITKHTNCPQVTCFPLNEPNWTGKFDRTDLMIRNSVPPSLPEADEETANKCANMGSTRL